MQCQKMNREKAMKKKKLERDNKNGDFPLQSDSERLVYIIVQCFETAENIPTGTPNRHSLMRRSVFMP